MSAVENIVVTVIVLLAPVGLVYGWLFYVRQMSGHGAGWRRWTTLAALLLVSLAVVMWPVARMTAPDVNWHTWLGAGAYWHWVNAWARVALGVLVVALFVSPLARPRLIAPLIVACLGVGLCWICADIP